MNGLHPSAAPSPCHPTVEQRWLEPEQAAELVGGADVHAPACHLHGARGRHLLPAGAGGQQQRRRHRDAARRRRHRVHRVHGRPRRHRRRRDHDGRRRRPARRLPGALAGAQVGRLACPLLRRGLEVLRQGQERRLRERPAGHHQRRRRCGGGAAAQGFQTTLHL
uniref:Uncharacterized protein n=1 Tax=Triticum urartu TaxID=4572 RepID=A0A8R7QIE0_TRIUA